MFPSYLYHHPDPVDDLGHLDTSVSELAITGKTRGIGRLDKCSRLEKVWIRKINQREFEDVVSRLPQSLKCMVFYEMRVQDLLPLGRFKALSELSMDWNTKAETLDALGNLHQLQILRIQDFSKIRSIAPLERCTRLSALSLCGGIWNTLRLDTLAPVGGLPLLEKLELASIRVGDESLEPLVTLPKLRELSLSNQFPVEEYARLSVYLPDTKCDQFQPYVQWLRPDDDSSRDDIMVTGRRKPFLNSSVDQDRMRKYERDFRRLQERFRRELAAAN